jgi:hypothetical protein
MSLSVAGPTSGVFFAGNDQAWIFTVSLDGEDVDLDDMVCRFSMARPGGFAAVLSTEDTTPTATATVNDDSTFTITASAENTAFLLGTYEYQAQVENADGEKTNVLHGYFTFKQNII